MEPLEEMF